MPGITAPRVWWNGGHSSKVEAWQFTEELKQMHSVLWFLLPVACAAALLFSGYRRWAKQQHDLQMFRERIMFGTSAGYSGEWKKN